TGPGQQGADRIAPAGCGHRALAGGLQTRTTPAWQTSWKEPNGLQRTGGQIIPLPDFAKIKLSMTLPLGRDSGLFSLTQTARADHYAPPDRSPPCERAGARPHSDF